jgi:hypothetical protein
MIVDRENSLVPDLELSIGTLNGSIDSLNSSLREQLINHTARPLMSFRIAENGEGPNENKVPNPHKTVEYVFEQSSNAINTLSNYLSKNKINLLCLGRENQNTNDIVKPYLSDIINKVNVSLLVSGSRSNILQQN